ncbi:MAG: hypothetical protein HY675_13275 [Chloroflexi bacterium]|nr:hypothetical protein [Chloroflexota bacterium]
MTESHANLTPLDRLVLGTYPYPIAVNYRQMLDARYWPVKVLLGIRVFEYTVRILSLCAISQYVSGDAASMKDKTLNQLLIERLARASMGTWKQMFFDILKAYAGRREQLFVTEMYDLYWDTSRSPHRKRPGVYEPFDKIIGERNRLVHEMIFPGSDDEWVSLGRRIVSLTQEVLNLASFFQGYDLLSILARRGDGYAYTLFKGERIVTLTGRLASEQELTPNWFYLGHQNSRFLRLHPLFLGWEEERMSELLESCVRDAALFDKFSSRSVSYVATVLQKTFDRKELVPEFEQAVYENIRMLKRTRHEAPQLTWNLLHAVAVENIEHCFGDLKSRYCRDRYLQRQEAKRAFHDFIASDKKLFVVVGKSGVGKSSFFLSIVDENVGMDDVCFLLFDANSIRLGPDQRLTEKLGEHFKEYVSLRRLDGNGGSILDSEVDAVNFLAEIDRIVDIDSRKVVLVIDAINEHSNPYLLFDRIKEMIEQNPKRWLKVAVSSRPEVWDKLSKHVILPGGWFFASSRHSATGVSLIGDRCSVELRPFTEQERPLVFDLYRGPFKIQTYYEELSPEIREVIADPLALSLIAETNRNRRIPEHLDPREIYRLYVEHLLTSEPPRLREADVEFLESEIMPLLVDVDKAVYRRGVAASDLHNRRTRDGRSLVDFVNSEAVITEANRHNLVQAGSPVEEKIEDESPLSDGTLVCQSFINLRDVEIIVKKGEGSDYELGFLYERFYEHFAGKRLQYLATQEGDKAAFFARMIAITKEHHFLWGGVKNALIGDAKELVSSAHRDRFGKNAPTTPFTEKSITAGMATLRSLCFSQDTRVKEMLVDALCDLGRDGPQWRAAVEKLLSSIVIQRKKPSLAARWTARLRSRVAGEDVVLRNAKKIAVEVGSVLGFRELLQAALLDDYSTVRAAAVRYSYHLWERDRAPGFQIVHWLADSVAHGFIPNLRAFEGVFVLSLTILFDHPEDTEVRSQLQKAWRVIIDKFLGVNASASRWSSVARTFVRELIFRLAASIIFKLAKDLPKYVIINLPDAEEFFKLPKEDKQLYRRLAQYIECKGSYDHERMKLDLCSALSFRNLHIEGVNLMALVAHLTEDPVSFVPFMEEVREIARHDPVPSPWVSTVPFLLQTLLDRDPNNDLAHDLFVTSVKLQQEYYVAHSHVPGKERTQVYKAPYASFLGPSAMYDSERYNSQGKEKRMADFIRGRVMDALERRDAVFFDYLLDTELQLVGLEMKKPAVALEVVSMFFSRLDFSREGEDREIVDMTERFLARLRLSFPAEVDDFLEDQRADEEFSLRVRTNEPVETVGGLIGLRSWFFARDTVIQHSPSLRAVLIRIMAQAADCKDFKAWADYFIRELINLAYGKDILRRTSR